MDVNSLIFLFAGIAISSAIFALLIFFYPRLVEREAGAAEDMERLLLPIAFYGIDAAYRTTECALGDGYPPLSPADKKKIAESVYHALPAKVGDLDASAVRERISPQQFEQIVQDAFKRSEDYYKANEMYFDEQYEAWKKEQAGRQVHK
ncbi:MAG: hypothetical protein HY782_20210 [Chloroflexi bacterium]|nr:hypothetical protein [Chloroflexota bacterium]